MATTITTSADGRNIKAAVHAAAPCPVDEDAVERAARLLRYSVRTPMLAWHALVHLPIRERPLTAQAA